MREHVYSHLQQLPCRYLDQAETGDLLQRCTSDVETLRQFLATQVVEIGRAVIMLLMPIPLLLALDWRMTLISVALLPLISLSALVFFARVKRAFRATDEAEGHMTARLQENLTGVRVVRAFARQAHECARFDDRNRNHRTRHYRLYRSLAAFWGASDLLVFLQKGLVVSAGAWFVAGGSLAVGAYFYFLTAVAMFVTPVRQMGRILADLGLAQVAAGSPRAGPAATGRSRAGRRRRLRPPPPGRGRSSSTS